MLQLPVLLAQAEEVAAQTDSWAGSFMGLNPDHRFGRFCSSYSAVRPRSLSR